MFPKKIVKALLDGCGLEVPERLKEGRVAEVASEGEREVQEVSGETSLRNCSHINGSNKQEEVVFSQQGKDTMNSLTSK